MEIKANQSRITQAKLFCEWLYIFVDRAAFDFLPRFEKTGSCINARRHAGSRQLCLLALSRSGRHVLALLLCAGLTALY